MEKQQKANSSKMRLWFRAASFAFANGYAGGWKKGTIYNGPNKQFCLPGLNCYSCPGALASCPIGSLQAVLDSGHYRFSLYVFGIIGIIGMLFGRLICGWVCPFGLVQDLLHKIPIFNKKKDLPGHKVLKYLKYVILAVFVILLPMLVLNRAGIGKPWFCEYICPSGTLFGGIPLVIAQENLREAIGSRFIWKCAVLAAVIILSIRFYRPFCKYLCPLGALYGFANPVSSYRLRVDQDACVACGACQKACGMNIKVWENPNSMECIRCGKCQSVCPNAAITSTWGDWKRGMTRPDPTTLRPVIPAEPSENPLPETAPEERPRPASKGKLIFGILILCTGTLLMLSALALPLFELFFNGITGFSAIIGFNPVFTPIPPIIFLMVLGVKLIKAQDEISTELTGEFAKITLLSVPGSVIIFSIFTFIMSLCYQSTLIEALGYASQNAVYSILTLIVICVLAMIAMKVCAKKKTK